LREKYEQLIGKDPVVRIWWNISRRWRSWISKYLHFQCSYQ